jgi:aryl-alcohol dehydrogenase-like predicted oxidoreductase
MDYRYLGRSALQVSPICLGAMMFGGETDETVAGRIIAKAADQGINFLDTADVYNGGRSEEVTGRCIAASRDHWVVATKFGFGGPGPNHQGQSRKWIIQSAEASLRRLGSDYIDILYFHRAMPGVPLEEGLRAIGDLIRQGKIRYYGVSNFMGPSRDRAADRQPAALQYRRPQVRGGAIACGSALRARSRLLQPARARRPERQICARCPAAG